MYYGGGGGFDERAVSAHVWHIALRVLSTDAEREARTRADGPH